MESSEAKLLDLLARLYDRMAADRRRKFEKEEGLSGAEWAAFTESDQAAYREIATRRTPPWSKVADDERREYGASPDDLDADMKAAFGTSGVFDASPDAPPQARAALIRLLAWDLQFLQHSSVITLLRHAQLANDQDLLKKVGHALAQNRRYGGRSSRSQRQMTRLLSSFTFGDPNAYADPEHLEKVYTALYDAYTQADDVSDDDPAWKVLTDREYFRKHLRRIGLLK